MEKKKVGLANLTSKFKEDHICFITKAITRQLFLWATAITIGNTIQHESIAMCTKISLLFLLSGRCYTLRPHELSKEQHSGKRLGKVQGKQTRNTTG